MKEISRRDFLKGALAGTASVAAACVLGAGTAQKLTAKASGGIYTPGTYSSKVNGIGDIVVTLTFDENSITDVALDLSNETADIGQAAEEELKAAILSAQSSDFDAVSGASVTSTAVAKGVANCIAQATGEAAIEVISDEEDSEDGDWLGTEPDIPDSEISAEYDTEILVIGCGTGGMFTVCAAAEEGADVIGIDRFATGVGIRDDLGALNSRYQQEWGTEIDPMDYVTMATQYAAGHINQNLVKLFTEESAETINWYGDRLAERGVELWHESGDADDKARYKHYPTGHSPRWTGSDDGEGNELDGNKVLYDYAVSLGARFDYETTMIKLVKDGDTVTVCIATNANGDYVKYNASKGVVVCTGGYSLNYEMMEALQPWNLNIIAMNGSEPGAHGDGIKACLWAGAKMDETHSMMMFDRCALRKDQVTGRL